MGNILKAKNSIYRLFVFFIIGAEIIFTYGHISIGVIIYLFTLIALLIIAHFKYQESAPALYLALTLIPLIRIISVSIPLSGIPEVFWFAVVSVPLFIAGAIVVEIVGLTPKEMGFSFDRLHNQLLIALLGLPLGFIEFFIYRPGIINTIGGPKITLMWILIFLICVGFLEEFLFRGILFNIALEVFGSPKALYFTSLLYATLTISGESFGNVIYAFLISILFCRLFFWQKSLLGLSFAHGLINITVYVICPFIF